jgi:tetratricopeptide (TPR) repeat protein
VTTTKLSIPALLVALSLISFVSVSAQTTGKPLNLVAPTGTGRVIVPPPGDLDWKSIFLYDNGARPVMQASSKSTGIVVSWVLFPNLTGSSKPNVCRDDVINAAMRAISPTPEMSNIKNIKKADHAPLNGQAIATGSYFVVEFADLKVHEQNLFGVASSPTVCANIHISKTAYTPADDAAMSAMLDAFVFDPDYKATAVDYMTLGSIFYRITKAYDAAAVYYQRALDTLPANSPLDIRRYVVDQLAMSYGISGQVKKSRAVNEAAIQSDPDYPLYYYNLACADAEQGKTADAKLHLQQAFDRRANTLKGETLPDPTKDDSILKLKKDKAFWEFVQSLPKS